MQVDHMEISVVGNRAKLDFKFVSIVSLQQFCMQVLMAYGGSQVVTHKHLAKGLKCSYLGHKESINKAPSIGGLHNSLAFIRKSLHRSFTSCTIILEAPCNDSL